MWRRSAPLVAAGALLALVVALPFVIWNPASQRLERTTPAAVSGDEPHYLLVVHSLLYDRDTKMRLDYDRSERGEPRAGRRFAGQRLDHHTLLYEPATGDTARWVDIFNWRSPVVCRRGDASCSGFERKDADHFTDLDRVIERSAHPLGFPLLIAAVLAPTLPAPHQVETRMALVIALLSWLGVLAVFGAARAHGLSPRWSMIAAGLVGLASPHLVYARSYFAEPLIGAALAGALWAVASRRWRTAGALTVVAIWIKPFFVLIPMAWCVAAWLRGERRGAVHLGLVVTLGSVALMVLNYQQTRTLLVSGVWGWQGITDSDQLSRTLMDPRYGLLRFVPWTLLSFAMVGAWTVRMRQPGARTWDWVVVPVVPILILLAVHRPLGATCYGPRYWVPMLPLLAVAAVGLVHELRASRWQRRAAWSALGALAAVSAMVALSGALLYRHVWDQPPHAALTHLIGL